MQFWYEWGYLDEIRLSVKERQEYVKKEHNPIVMDWTGCNIMTPWFKKELSVNKGSPTKGQPSNGEPT